MLQTFIHSNLAAVQWSRRLFPQAVGLHNKTLSCSSPSPFLIIHLLFFSSSKIRTSKLSTTCLTMNEPPSKQRPDNKSRLFSFSPFILQDRSSLVKPLPVFGGSLSRTTCSGMREGQLKMCPALFKVNYVTVVVGKRVGGCGGRGRRTETS